MTGIQARVCHCKLYSIGLLKPFISFRMLNCGHSFCKNCLSLMIPK